MALIIGIDNDSDDPKPIYHNGNKTKYGVTKNGDIYNLETNRKLKTMSVYNTDYEKVKLYGIDGQKHTALSVHRIVAQTFIPNPDNLPEVNHINMNKHDNRVYNLEWVSRSGNSIHKKKNGVGPFLDGEKNITAKYSDGQIDEVCRLLSVNAKPKDISKKTGVSTAMISMIKIGKVRKHQSRKYRWDVVHKKDMVGDKHIGNVISEDIATKICEMLSDGMRVKDIASQLGVKSNIISNIKTRKSWTIVSKKYNW